MNGAERIAKFEEFKRLQKAGQLKSHEIVSQLGISKNTLRERVLCCDGLKAIKRSL